MPLRRRQHDVEEERHDRWLVSYSDFITLLFAFFVVMYAVSSVNAGKYRVLSESLGSAFRDPLTRLMPIDLGGGLRHGEGGEAVQAGSAPAPIIASSAPPQDSSLEPVPTSGPEAFAAETPSVEFKDMAQAGAYLRQHLAGVIDDERFKVRHGDHWLQIELQSEVLFPSGSAQVTGAAIPVLDRIAPVLRGMPGDIRVEGYTDATPTAGGRFPSNWELSAARASGIVRRFAIRGVAPARLAAVGHGEFHPIADNASAEGRRANRRVVIAVAAAPELIAASGAAAPAGGAPPAADAAQRVLILQRASALPPPLELPR